MKTYVITWDERHSITLEAKNEEEAKNLVDSGDYDANNESAEMNGSLEAYEIKLK